MIIKDLPFIETAAGVMILTMIVIGCVLFTAYKVINDRWRDDETD